MNSRAADGMTLLMMAAKAGHEKITQILIDSEVNLEVKTDRKGPVSRIPAQKDTNLL